MKKVLTPDVIVAEAALEVGAGTLMDVPTIKNPLPMVLVVIQDDEEGAGCADGVAGSPWWKVEAP